MLSNMATSLILHKRISTTLAKAKELKKYLEPLVTRAKEDTTHNRRMAFSYLRSKEAIIELFGGIIEKVATRPGGYTRIIKTGFRLGDNAEMCIIELVDYNELMLKDSKPAKKTTRRSRRGTGTAASVATETSTDVTTNEDGKAEEPSAPKASEDSTEDETENK
jgi:large subunit ribosomal protein L17